MVVPLVPLENIEKKKRKTKKEKYAKYARALAPLIEYFKVNIQKSPDHKIRIRVRDLAREMGPDFETKEDKSIYWAVKYVLFNEGIVVTTGTEKTGAKLLVLRMATPKDKLPPSLAKALEPSEKEMPSPEEE